MGLLISQALASKTSSRSNQTNMENKTNQNMYLEKRLTAVESQIKELSKSISTHKSEENKEKTTSLNTDPIPATLKDKLVTSVRNLVYNPEHPGEFLDKLIAGYSAYLFLEKQLTACLELQLGKNNQIVNRIKENYQANALYVEALKQQKLMLEKSK